MNWSLPRFAIARPVTMLMLIITLLVMGAIALYLTPLEFMMHVDSTVIRCWIPYPGAAPRQVEQQIAIPAEGEFQQLPHLRRLLTNSSEQGCSILLFYDWGTDMSLAAAEVRDRIERLKLRLPKEVDRIAVFRYSSDQSPVFRFALYQEEGAPEISTELKNLLRNRLVRIDGVAEAELFGEEEPRVSIDFNQNALRSRNLGVYDVVSRLQSSNINVGVGQLRDGETSYFVRTLGEAHTLEDLQNLPVSASGIRLREVAEVSLGVPEATYFQAMNGRKGLYVQVFKESEANTVATCDAIRAQVDLLKQDPLFAGIETFVVEDHSEAIRFALSTLANAGKFGGVLALCVLFVFLRRIRPTIIVALITPASMVVAMIYIYVSGKTLNLVSIAGMLVCLGMLVDNAIVVIENIQRYNEQGLDRILNARRGASEVALAITAATLTTTVVFVPVMYLEGGELAMLMKEFAAPVVCSLLASLVLALTVLPLAESRISSARRQRGNTSAGPPKQGVFSRFHPIEDMRRAYGRMLHWALHRRIAVLGTLALIMAATYLFPFQSVGMRPLPPLDVRLVSFNVSADQNYGLDAVRNTLDHLEALIDEHREELGIEVLFKRSWGSGGQLQAFLANQGILEGWNKPRYSTEEVREILSEILPRELPGARINGGVGEGAQEETQQISVWVRGDDGEVAQDLANAFARTMALTDGIGEVQSGESTAMDELQIQIDLLSAGAAGTSPTTIARTVDFALRGTRLPSLKHAEGETMVWARFQGEDRRNKTDLENVMVEGGSSGLVPLSQLVTLRHSETPSGINRQDAKGIATVVGRVQEADLSRIRRQLEEVMTQFSLPPGYSISFGDEVNTLDENARNYQNAVLLAIVLIYIVMAALFESVLLPFSILSTVALAYIGVYWTMYLTGTPMDTLSLIGSILMCGIVVNNGIVIVDCVNQGRREGLGRNQAIVQAGLHRFRPVLMTSLTTILGTAPLAIGGAGGQNMMAGLGRAFAGGLTAGTLLTLFVVPVCYTLIDDSQVWCGRFAGSLAEVRRKRSWTG